MQLNHSAVMLRIEESVLIWTSAVQWIKGFVLCKAYYSFLKSRTNHRANMAKNVPHLVTLDWEVTLTLILYNLLGSYVWLACDIL